RLLEIVRHFAETNKPIASICHGAQILTASGAFRGRSMNAYPAVGPEVTAAGCTFVSLDLPDAYTDGNLVTGPAWTAHVEWLRQFQALLADERAEAPLPMPAAPVGR